MQEMMTLNVKSKNYMYNKIVYIYNLFIRFQRKV